MRAAGRVFPGRENQDCIDPGRRTARRPGSHRQSRGLSTASEFQPEYRPHVLVQLQAPGRSLPLDQRHRCRCASRGPWEKSAPAPLQPAGSPHPPQKGPVCDIAGTSPVTKPDSRSGSKAPKKGKIKSIDNRKIATLARLAGAPGNKGAGVYLHKKLKEKVNKRETILTIYAENKEKLNYAKTEIKEIFEIS